MVSAPAIRFVLYTEDSAVQSLETIGHLLRSMLKQVCSPVKLNHVEIEPVLPPAERVSGSLWKSSERSRDSQRRRRLLIRAVARALELGKVVFFHVDADAIWLRFEDCENLQRHWPRFCADVLAAWGVNKDRSQLEQLLILAMPFYELESWAFANTRRLREILTEPDDLAAFARWEGDLGALDEIADIKEVLSIRDGHNRELVQTRHGFPAAALDAVGKSYAATIARLRASEVVQGGLETAAARPY